MKAAVLPVPVCGDSEQVAALQQGRDRLGLDRGRVLIVLERERLEHRLRKPESLNDM
jgi:hypothetical protein